MIWLYIIILVVAVAIIIRLVPGEKVGTGYIYKVAFSVVAILFVSFMAGGINLLLTPDQTPFDDAAAIMFLFFAVLSLPLGIWLGIRVFKKRTGEEGEKLDDGSTLNSDEYREKIPIGLGANTAGLLCYSLGWVSGIFFILIERQNKLVRFHAVQSIIVFGILSIAGIIPYVILGLSGAIYFILYAFAFTLWIVLMLEAYHGKRYKLPWVGNLAEKYS